MFSRYQSQFFPLCLIISSCLTFKCSAQMSRPSSSGSSPIVFPGPQSDGNDEIDALLIQTAGLKNVTEILARFGVSIENSGETALGRKRERNYAEAAACEPELRTVEIPEKPGSRVVPACVRVKRCGGCCPHGMTCTPTKISHKYVAHFRLRKRRDASYEATPESSQVEVHDECKCMCRVKKEDCHPVRHFYNQNLCQCVCRNSEAAIDCRNTGAVKRWDEEECECKCRDVRHCHSGTVFSHVSCSCESY